MRSLKDKAYDILIILTLLNIMFINTPSLKASDINTEAATMIETESIVENEEVEVVSIDTEILEVETTEVVEYTPTIKEIQDTPDNGKPDRKSVV